MVKDGCRRRAWSSTSNTSCEIVRVRRVPITGGPGAPDEAHLDVVPEVGQVPRELRLGHRLIPVLELRAGAVGERDVDVCDGHLGGDVAALDADVPGLEVRVLRLVVLDGGDPLLIAREGVGVEVHPVARVEKVHVKPQLLAPDRVGVEELAEPEVAEPVPGDELRGILEEFMKQAEAWAEVEVLEVNVASVPGGTRNHLVEV